MTLVGAACAAALPSEALVPVEDTEDVAKAKEEFEATFKAVAAAAEAGEVPEVVIPEGSPVPVEDTPEVAAAKVKFQAAFDAAASAAEAAPDFDVDGKLSTYTGFLSTVDGKLSPFYTNTFPFGAYGLHAPIVASAPAATPLAYSSLGLHGIYGYGYPGIYGFPNVYGFPGPFVYSPVVKEEEPKEEAVEEA